MSLCINPYESGPLEFGCGQCMPCLTNRKRIWTSRIMLESHSHEFNTFATLTYKNAPPELIPDDLSDFMRKLRKCYPTKVRYYGVGEYGTQNLRPHFHVVLFGVSWLDRYYVLKAWSDGGVPKGFVDTAELNSERAAYIAGYVCKKVTSFTNPALEGKQREFARMSLRPGIGALECENIGKKLKGAFENGYCALDVPGELRQVGKKMPLGRYVRGELRKAVGWDKTMPQEAKNKLRDDLESVDRTQRNIKRESYYNSAIARFKISESRRKL